MSLKNVRNDFYDWIYIYVIGGLMGTIYETILIYVIHGVIKDRSGSIFTPDNYVYGIGAILIFIAMYKIRKPITIFVSGSLLGGIVEYGMSLFQEYVLGSRSWDYSRRPLNINGRTTIPYMLIWGVLCYLSMRFVFPFLLTYMHKIPDQYRKIIAMILKWLL